MADDNQQWFTMPDGKVKPYPQGMSEDEIRADIEKNYPDAFKPEGEKRAWYNDTIVSKGLRAGADYLTRKEKEAQTADQAAAARGEQPGVLGRAARFARTAGGGMLADTMRTGAALTTPRALAEMGAAALTPTVGAAHFGVLGAEGAYDAYRKAQREGWTPENVQNFLMGGGGALLGAAGMGEAGMRGTARGRIPRVAARVEPQVTGAPPTAEIPRVGAGGEALAPPTGPTRTAAPAANVPVTAQFNRLAREMYGRSYDALQGDEKAEVAKAAVPGTTEQPILPVERRATPGTAPAGMAERRVAGPDPMRMALMSDIQKRMQGLRPDDPALGILQSQLEDMRAHPFERAPESLDINKIRAAQKGPMPTTRGGPPAAPAPMQITPPTEQIPPVEQPPRRLPTQPGTPERPPPQRTPFEQWHDPLRHEFPDPAVRRFVRANGPELVRATANDPEALQAVHDLRNVEIRQAASNAGLKETENAPRQGLIRQLLERGYKPRDIVSLAKGEPIGYQRQMPIPPGKLIAPMTMLSVMAHELGHAILAGLEGLDLAGIISHRHPRLMSGNLRGATAATLVDLTPFKYEGRWSPARLGAKTNAVLDMFAAGAAIDEVMYGINRETNPGLHGDHRMTQELLTALGVSPHLHRAVFSGMVDKAIEKLDGLHDLIRQEAGRREENLPVEFHASKERLDKIVARAKEIKDAQAAAKAAREAGGGAAPGVPAPGGGAGAADVAGREGGAPAESFGLRPPPEKLKPFSAPRNTYKFRLLEDVGDNVQRFREISIKASDLKRAINMARAQAAPGWRSLTLISETKPPVEAIPMEVAPEVRRASPDDIKNISPKNQKFFQRFLGLLTQDEARMFSTRPVQQRNLVKAFQSVKPTFDELVNIAKAGEPFGGWWQRFIDTFRTLGKERYAAQMERVPQSDLHEGRLKAIHSSLSGNKAVAQANDAAWIAYHDWLERGRPTNKASINSVVKNAHAISGFRGLDTVKLYKLVNSPEWRGEKPFTGAVFSPESPIAGKTPGARKLPSMLGGTAGAGNWLRIVFDTHMKDLFGVLGLTDAHYVALSMHIRRAADHLGIPAMEAQGQMWGVILGLKYLMKQGMTPAQAARAFGPDVLRQVGKDYAQTVLERTQVKEGMTDKQIAKVKEVREAMEGLRDWGLDTLGDEALEELGKIVESGQQRLSQRMPRISRVLLERSARRIQRNLAERRARKYRERE